MEMKLLLDWNNYKKEEDLYLAGCINSFLDENFSRTIESLTAYRAYQMGGKGRTLYAAISRMFDPIFLSLPSDKIDRIEKIWPPYDYVKRLYIEEVGLTEEHLKILNKKPYFWKLKERKVVRQKQREILERIIPEEAHKIFNEQRKILEKGSLKVTGILYSIVGIHLYLTGGCAYILPWMLTVPIPIIATKLLTLRLKNSTLKKFLNLSSNFYAMSYSFLNPLSAIVILAELKGFKFLFSKIERLYESLPKHLRFYGENFLSGVKSEKFDEERLKELAFEILYDIRRISPSLSEKAIDKFADDLERGLIELKKSTGKMGFFQRRSVVDYKTGKILNNTYWRKQRKDVREKPWKYLGFGVDRNGFIKGVRDVIGIFPCKIDGTSLTRYILSKEVYAAIKYREFDELMRRISPDQPPSHIQSILLQKL